MATREPADPDPVPRALDEVLEEIASSAAELDRNPRFPGEALRALAGIGALSALGPQRRERAPEDWSLLRRIARADASVARIADGHLNALQRLALSAAAGGAGAGHLDRAQAGECLLGLWGADPRPGEGPPARIGGSAAAPVLAGVKTFCSGGHGLDATLVLARTESAPAPQLCLIDVDGTVEEDRTWFNAMGMRASESHRMVFHETPVAGLIGEPGHIGAQPWFSLDALRTASTWAGMADAAAGAACAELAVRQDDVLAELAAGRIAAAQTTVDVWFEAAARRVQDGDELGDFAVALRAEVIRAIELILDEAARACGSGPFARGGPLERARRDLELFTQQHRIDPLLMRMGRAGNRGSP